MDEEDNTQNVKDEGTRALKRIRRQEIPPINIESLEGTESMELIEVQETTSVVKEVEEGSSEVRISSLGMITNLVHASITSKHSKECLLPLKFLPESSRFGYVRNYQ